MKTDINNPIDQTDANGDKIRYETFSSHTPDWLRSFKGCEHYSDEEANEILNSLNSITYIFLFAAENINNKAKTIPLLKPDNKKAA